MISFGSRDGRNMVGFGIGDVGDGGGVMAMEETELEEGEACSYQNDEESNVDPDAFTYIDEKLQDVLGHFKKDFEGGVSTENLGAKYGGYGSFLTQRSPVWSSSRSSVNVQNNHSHKSPTSLSAEGGNYSSLAQVNGPRSSKHVSASAHSASSQEYRALAQYDSVKQNERIQFRHSIEGADNSANLNDQRTLKVRIKVSSDNEFAKKNTAIYSGLGLVSSSSSFDDSPMEGEGLSPGLQFPGDESPSRIIRIMTSLPIYGGFLLSPLSEGLERLAEKLLQDPKIEPAAQNSHESCVTGSNIKSNKFLLDDMEIGEKSQLYPRFRKSGEDLGDGFDLILREVDYDAEACEELISKALKLPLLSNSHDTPEDSAKGFLGSSFVSGERKRGSLKENSNIVSNAVKQEPVEPILCFDNGWNEEENRNANLAVKSAEDRKVDLQIDVASYPRKVGDRRGETANSSTDTDKTSKDFGLKARMASAPEISNFHKQKAGKGSTSHEQEAMRLPPGGEQLPSRAKKKQKGNHVIGAHDTDVPTESSGDTVLGSKGSHAYGYSSKNESESCRKQKDLRKARDKYKDFFGDMIEDGDDMNSPDVLSDGRLKTSQISEKGSFLCQISSRERSNLKETQVQLTSRGHPKVASDCALASDNAPSVGDPAPTGNMMNENWVQCDKCLKWRLLPLGTKEDSLPEKWLCSMLNWLPGKNSCSITEEETTKAVRELYQPLDRNGLNGPLTGVFPGVTAATNLHPNQNPQDIFPGVGKKHGVKEVPNIDQGFIHSVKKTSLGDAIRSSQGNELPFQHLGNVTYPVREANQSKKKSKKKPRESYSDGGHSKNRILKGEKVPEQDNARLSKNIKTKDEKKVSTNDRGNDVLIHSLSYELPTSGAQNSHLTNHESLSSRSSKGPPDDVLPYSNKESKFEAQPDCFDMRKLNDSDTATKKRKVKCSQGSSHPSILSGKVVSESEVGKKVRISKFEVKESSSSRGNSSIEKKRKNAKEHPLGTDVVGTLGCLDDARSLKRELESAATSSSSKVSGSQKSRSSFHEVKGSPVESVSSSPFRIAPGIKSLMEKDKDSSKRCAGIEDSSGSLGVNLPENDLHLSMHGVKGRSDGCLVYDKAHIKNSAELTSGHLTGGPSDTLQKRFEYSSEALASDEGLNEANQGACNNSTKGFQPRNSAKDSSWCKGKHQKHKTESDKEKVKIAESHDNSEAHAPTAYEKSSDSRIKFQKTGFSADRVEKGSVGEKKSAGIMPDEGSKKDGEQYMGQGDSNVNQEAICSHGVGSGTNKKRQTEYGEKASKRLYGDNDEQMRSLSAKDKSGNKIELSDRCALPYKVNGAHASSKDVHGSGKILKEQMTTKNSDNQSVARSSASKHLLSNEHRLKDQHAPSPVRRDSHGQAATNALKEATDLKHLADRLKNSGNGESTGFYFEAALKFLHGACLLESRGSENARRGDMLQSMQVYRSTANLCEFCAHEYEKKKDLASAALAYKCMEVAYLRVVYSSHPAASRDRHELQTSLQTVPPGESPSSSASDIDNTSNPATAEKVVQPREGNSPQTAGNHVIAPRNRPNFMRLLNFTQDVNSAMEASRKSRGAFAAAKISMQQRGAEEGITCVQRVLDFNFHDVDGLLHLVRIAVEAINP